MGAVGKMQDCRGKREMGMASGLPKKKVVFIKAARKRVWSLGRSASGLKQVCIVWLPVAK